MKNFISGRVDSRCLVNPRTPEKLVVRGRYISHLRDEYTKLLNKEEELTVDEEIRLAAVENTLFLELGR